MNPELYKRVSEIVGRAAKLPSGEQKEYVAEACGSDEALRQEVESLLRYAPTREDLLERPVPGMRPDSGFTVVCFEGEPQVTRLESGQRVGSYRLLEEIGQGGMGTVFLAAREDDFEKKVALKLINTRNWPAWYRRDQDGQDLVRRFHNERQILAQLEHPNIARILDGGTTEDGIPYFAMEYVDGVPIDVYCDATKLSIRERLKIFRKVCAALHLAHQNLVVHRDLKPNNILVTAAGEPKLLDFGIAKRLVPEDHTEALVTLTGQRPMTLKYASPEQIEGLPITTASDTYALGVLLYQLLTGHFPYHLKDGEFLTLAMAICEQEPKTPSSAVMHAEELYSVGGNTTVTPESVSSTREGSPVKLKRSLSGDLDSIVLKALAKDPRQRYSSVEQLAEDIAGHLSGLPVRAREGTLLYRGGKFLRRHLVRIATAAVLLLALVAGVVSREQTKEAERQARDAEQQADVAFELTYDVLSIALSPRKSPGKSLAARELLDQLVERIQARLKDEPKLLADQLELFGRLYGRFGFYPEAEEILEESLQIRQELYGGDHHILARGLTNLGASYYKGGDYNRAEELYRASLAMKQRLGQQEIDLVKVMSNLAAVLNYRGQFEEAEALYQRCLRLRIEDSGRDFPAVAKLLRSLGVIALNQGRLEQAAALVREALEIWLRAFGPESLEVAKARSSLGRVLQAQGNPDKAEEVFHQVLALRREFLGEDHPHVALSKKDLAAVLLDRDEVETAGILLTEALATLRHSKPEGAWEIAEVESLWGTYLGAQGRLEEAKPCLLDSYRELERLRGAEAISTLKARSRIFDLNPQWGKELDEKID